MQTGCARRYTVLASVLAVGLGLSTAVIAADSIRGVITDRGNDGTLTVQTDFGSNVVVVLTDSTKVRRIDGERQVRMNAGVLTPGLRIKVRGEAESPDRFIAQKIDFSRSDLKTANEIAGGIGPTDARSLANQQRIQQHAQMIQQHNQALERHAQEIAGNKAQIDATSQKMVATTGALAARINNLDDYTAISKMTVYFANGRATVAKKYAAELQQFAAQAKNVPGSVVQVQGFASDVGPRGLNQRLSLQRADAVTSLLQQSGVPPTSIVVPAGMGVTEQVASNKTKAGQAQNRRTVVTILQNKGISGDKQR